MHLSNQVSEFAADWLKHHCEPQPIENYALTWFVAASTLYTAYVNACYANNQRPVSFDELWTVLRLTHPRVTPKKLHGHGVYTGMRFYIHKIGDGLKF